MGDGTEIPLSGADLSNSVKQSLQSAHSTTFLYFSPKKKKKEHMRKTSLSLECLSLFLLCLLNTHKEVWQSLKSPLLFKNSPQPSRQSHVCQRLHPSQEWYSELATKQGQAF